MRMLCSMVSNAADLDECRFRNGGCEQICINTVGSYRCTCNDGFKMAADERSCIDTPIVNSIAGTELEEGSCHASCRNFTFLHTVVQDVEKKLLLILQKENTKEISFKEDPKVASFPNQSELKGFPGPPGEMGPRGIKGETGIKGGPGPAGSPGQHGLPGSQGQPGPAGLKGPKGTMGFLGIEGKRGYRGERGHTGPIGDPGVKGEKGENGSSGIPGKMGLKGRIGPPGVHGLPGIPGRTPTFSLTSKMLEGKRGKRGPQGRTGPPGKPGQKGETGIPGPRGSKGESAIGEAVLNMIANLRRDILELQHNVLGGKTSSFNTMISGNNLGNLGNTLLTTDDEDLAGSGRNPGNPS